MVWLNYIIVERRTNGSP